MSQSGRRNDVTTEIVVGAFMFTILVVLLTMTVVISQNRFFEPTWQMTATFPDVGGLKEGEHVFLRGVRVGNVDRIQVAEEGEGVEVTMKLTREVTLHEDYALRVESASLLGGMRLNIDEGTLTLPEVPESTHDRLRGQPAPDLFGEASALVKDLRDITGQISSGEGTVGRLIQDDSLYEETTKLLKSLNNAAGDMEAVASSGREIAERLSAGRGTLGKLFSDDEALYHSLTNTLHQVELAGKDIRTVAQRLEAGEGTLGKLLSGDDKIFRDLKDTAASLKSFSEDLGQQEGTVGRLINEDTLYLKVEGLVDEARATIDDFRETSPITTFSTIFFGAF